MLKRALFASLIALPALAQTKATQAPAPNAPQATVSQRQSAPPPPMPEPAALAMQPAKLTFNEAIKRAVERNPTALQALAEIGRAQGIFEEVRSAALPTLFATGSLTHLDGDRVSVTPSPAAGGAPTRTVLASQNQRAANATLTIPLLAPKAWLQAAQAHEQVDIARYSLEDARRVVAVATARAYLSVMAQHRLVEIDLQARVDAKAHLDDAHARFEVGSGNRLDEVRAAQELETDEAQLSTALSNVTRAVEALGVLVGADGPIEVTDDLQLPNPPAPNEALQDAENVRADIKAGKVRTEEARKVVHDDYADYLPLLTAVVEPFYQNPALSTVPETGWQAQLVLTIPLYDGGLRYGRHKERKALYEESQIALDNLLRQARSDVRTAFDSVKRADEGLLSARNAAKLGHEALEMTNLAYREGATNDLEVVDAEQRARNADTAALVAEDAARQARIDLLSASGRFP